MQIQWNVWAGGALWVWITESKTKKENTNTHTHTRTHLQWNSASRKWWRTNIPVWHRIGKHSRTSHTIFIQCVERAKSLFTWFMYDQFWYIKQKWTESRNPDEKRNEKYLKKKKWFVVQMHMHVFASILLLLRRVFSSLSLSRSVSISHFFSPSPIYEHIQDGVRPAFSCLITCSLICVQTYATHAHIDLLPLMQMRCGPSKCYV